MKRSSLIAALAILLGMFAVNARAQGSGMYLENWKDILVGPAFEAGEAVNAGPILSGTKTSPRFAFAGGATMTYPWSENLALNLTLAYDSRAVNFHDQSTDTGGVDLHLNYLAIRPEFRLAGFIIGLGIGIPMGASAQYSSGGTLSGGPATSDMNLLLEGRVGGDITLVRTDVNQLHLLVAGSYGFSQALKSNYFDPADKTKNNGPIASGMIGLSYLFDVTPH